jgi:hypothetical protein
MGAMPAVRQAQAACAAPGQHDQDRTARISRASQTKPPGRQASCQLTAMPSASPNRNDVEAEQPKGLLIGAASLSQPLHLQF